MMITSKAQNSECCMCGDHGLSHELFRCIVCRFRSQHRYCSNIYPKAESYRVCNWCLIQKNDGLTTSTATIGGISNKIPCNSSSPTEKHNATKNKDVSGSRGCAGRKVLQPISPMNKPMVRSVEARSPLLLSGRKGIIGKDDKMRRTKSSLQMSNNYGGAGVIKHVIRNKVRRYKLLDEVSC